MNKLNVGDYCYIKGESRDYGIGKITQLNSGYSSNGGELIDILFKHSKHAVPKKDVISSPNIIDLIEVGDYLNGWRVNNIEKKNSDGGGTIIKIGNTTFNVLNNEDIYTPVQENDGYSRIEKLKSIVTHEQFENISYKVGE